MKPTFYRASATFGVLLLTTATASAHVIVTPNQVGVAATQTFSISVPSEKDAPLTTTALRLVMPSGLQEVMPTIQPGWTITTKTDSNDNVTEIDWTGGNIPAEQRDDLTFRAQVPATPTELDWKAYQTYSDGSVISWDQVPVAGHADDDSMTPYSRTTVINDLTGTTTSTPERSTPLWLGIATLLVSLGALVVSLRKTKN